MSSSGNSQDWLRRELGNVPLPPGLLARLKKIGSNGTVGELEQLDADIDAALCNVTLPAGLFTRLHAIAADDAFEKRLAEVAVPQGIEARLREIPQYTDREIDAALREVPVPPELLAHLRSIAGQRRPSRRRQSQRRQPQRWSLQVTRWVVAASLMIAVGLAYFGTLGGILLAVAQSGVPSNAEPRGRSLSEPALTLRVALPESKPQPVLTFDSMRLSAVRDGALSDEETASAPKIDPPLTGHPERAFAEIEQLFASRSVGKPVGMLSALGARGYLGFTPSDDTGPELEIHEPLPPRGIRPPAAVSGEQLLQYFSQGAHPFIAPDDHPALTLSEPPLSLSTRGYEKAWQALLSGEVPRPRDLRVEDFLAAIDYQLPAPQQRAISVHTAAGPVPWNGEDAYYLQVAIKARESLAREHPPTHLVVALDISASMARRGRLQQVQRALLEFAGQLGPSDRLSLLFFNQQSEVRVLEAGRADLAALRKAILASEPGGATNLGAAIKSAAFTAGEEASSPRALARVVLLTDGVGDIPEGEQAAIAALAGDMASTGLTLDVVSLGQQAAGQQSLAEIARRAGGQVRYADQAAGVRAALGEILTGQSTIVAEQVALRLKFNADAVASYRLIGHSASGAGGLLGGPRAVDLRRGETVTVLYQIKLKPKAAAQIAEVTARWLDPENHRPQSLEPRISRLQFATSVLETPRSLQWAMVAAEAGETLRGLDMDGQAPRGRLQRLLSGGRDQQRRNRAGRLRELHRFASGLPRRVRQNTTFAELLDLIELGHLVLSGRPVPEDFIRSLPGEEGRSLTSRQ